MELIWGSDFKKGQRIQERYERTFKYAMDWVAIQAYDAVDLLLWGLEQSGPNPSSLRDILHDRKSRDSAVPGLAGPIYFNRDGSLAREVTIAEYREGNWELRKD